jgi:hypothetical protein
MLNENDSNYQLNSTSILNQSKKIQIEADFRRKEAELIRIQAQIVCAKTQLMILAHFYINSNLYRAKMPVEFEL